MLFIVGVTVVSAIRLQAPVPGAHVHANCTEDDAHITGQRARHIFIW